MGRAVREGPARFRVVVEPPLPLPATGSAQDDVQALTAAMNARFEAWARERPAEWLWVHRRFDKAIYRQE
jgi:KDO2-lipid IV(A) lauroyltransferase